MILNFLTVRSEPHCLADKECRPRSDCSSTLSDIPAVSFGRKLLYGNFILVKFEDNRNILFGCPNF